MGPSLGVGKILKKTSFIEIRVVSQLRHIQYCSRLNTGCLEYIHQLNMVISGCPLID
jgi:hypothetical protein